MSASSIVFSMEKKTLESALRRIETLKVLRQNEVITEEDFLAQREQIINELTGTTYQSTSTGRKGSFLTSSTAMRRFTKSLTSSFIGSTLDGHRL
jgi:hypothetical protein